MENGDAMRQINGKETEAAHSFVIKDLSSKQTCPSTRKTSRCTVGRRYSCPLVCLVQLLWQHVWFLVDQCHCYQLSFRGSYSEQPTNATCGFSSFFLITSHPPSPMPPRFSYNTGHHWESLCTLCCFFSLTKFCCHLNVDSAFFSICFLDILKISTTGINACCVMPRFVSLYVSSILV